MDDLGLEQPRCPSCGTVMADHPRGYWCATCELLDDRSAELEYIEMPAEFDGPDFHDGRRRKRGVA